MPYQWKWRDRDEEVGQGSTRGAATSWDCVSRHAPCWSHKGYSRVAVSNDSVKTNLVQVGGLELKHLVNTSPVDGVGGLGDLLGSTIGTAKAGADELLTVLVEQVEGVKVSTGGDLDQLCKSVTDLTLGKGAKEAKVEESPHGSVVSTQTVLVVAVVDGNLDRHGGINQANDRGRDSDEVGVAAVRSTGKSGTLVSHVRVRLSLTT